MADYNVKTIPLRVLVPPRQDDVPMSMPAAVEDAGPTAWQASNDRATVIPTQLGAPLAANPAAPPPGGPSSGKIGWLQREGAPVTDVTAEFKATLANVRSGDNHIPDDAKDTVFLFVPGLMGNQYPGYMGENIKRLTGKGLEARMVPIETERGVEVNDEHIYQAMRAVEFREPGKKIMFVTHSMGGLAVTAALAKHPEMARVVRGVVAIQPPYGGSPIAQDMLANPQVSKLATFAFNQVLNGDVQALKDMSYDTRQKFVREHPYPADRVPTFSVATSRDPASSGLLMPASSFLSNQYGEKSDGLVLAKDAEIPGSRVIRLDDMDHANPAFKDPFNNRYDPGDLTEALITQALNATRKR